MAFHLIRFLFKELKFPPNRSHVLTNGQRFFLVDTATMHWIFYERRYELQWLLNAARNTVATDDVYYSNSEILRWSKYKMAKIRLYNAPLPIYTSFEFLWLPTLRLEFFAMKALNFCLQRFRVPVGLRVCTLMILVLLWYFWIHNSKMKTKKAVDRPI